MNINLYLTYCQRGTKTPYRQAFAYIKKLEKTLMIQQAIIQQPNQKIKQSQTQTRVSTQKSTQNLSSSDMVNRDQTKPGINQKQNKQEQVKDKVNSMQIEPGIGSPSQTQTKSNKSAQKNKDDQNQSTIKFQNQPRLQTQTTSDTIPNLNTINAKTFNFQVINDNEYSYFPCLYYQKKCLVAKKLDQINNNVGVSYFQWSKYQDFIGPEQILNYEQIALISWSQRPQDNLPQLADYYLLAQKKFKNLHVYFYQKIN